MNVKKPINDNRLLEFSVLDPERHYVDDYLTKAVEHFRNCKIHRQTICDGLVDHILNLLSADPARDPADESALWSDLHLLWPMRDRAEPLISDRMEALKRAERQRREK